jgi:NAD(P)-dependent dehydrogenase (short-subunit alcohol dehydrogenase family)
VTGASRGIGAAIATLFARAGAGVVVHYRNDAQGAAAVVEAICTSGGAAVAIHCELADETDVSRMFDRIETQGGVVDILVNNAGIFSGSPLSVLTTPEWRAMFAANMDAVHNVSRRAAQSMTRSGHGTIVNIASIAAHSPQPDMAHYSSAKAALLMYTRACAQELGPLGIRVNSVSPGLVMRDGLEESWPEGVTAWRTRAPLGRVVSAEAVAHACLFLAGEGASFITGQDIAVDAGMTCAALY